MRTNADASPTTCSPDRSVWPWEVQKDRLWSPLDMNPFNVSKTAIVVEIAAEVSGFLSSVMSANVTAAAALKQITDRLREQRVHVSTTIEPNLDDAALDALVPKLVERLELALIAARDLPIRPRLVDKLATLLSDIKETPIRWSAVVLRSRVDDWVADLIWDLTEPAFLYIPPSSRQLFEQKEPIFGASVAQTFPDAARDVAASGRCIALNEWTASVFHCMRVLEHGLRKMATRFNIPFSTDSWHKVLKGIEDGIDALRNKKGLTDADRKEITHYSEAAAQFRYIKDAWRNHVAHAREHYDERDANTVMEHVRELMQHLATDVGARPSNRL